MKTDYMKDATKIAINIATNSTKKLVDGKNDSYVQITVLILVFISHAIWAENTIISNILCGFICIFAIGTISAMVTSCKNAIEELASVYLSYCSLLNQLQHLRHSQLTVLSKGLMYDDFVDELIESLQEKKIKEKRLINILLDCGNDR